MEYIDEVWSDKAPLLPKDAYTRAQARFWADYVDKKIYECGTRLWALKGEGQEAAKKGMIEILTLLEGKLGDKTYFGGDTFGLVDIALVLFTAWFYGYETCANFIIGKECLKLVAWGKRCMERKNMMGSIVEGDPEGSPVVGNTESLVRDWSGKSALNKFEKLPLCDSMVPGMQQAPPSGVHGPICQVLDTLSKQSALFLRATDLSNATTRMAWGIPSDTSYRAAGHPLGSPARQEHPVLGALATGAHQVQNERASSIMQ